MFGWKLVLISSGMPIVLVEVRHLSKIRAGKPSIPCYFWDGRPALQLEPVSVIFPVTTCHDLELCHRPTNCAQGASAHQLLLGRYTWTLQLLLAALDEKIRKAHAKLLWKYLGQIPDFNLLQHLPWGLPEQMNICTSAMYWKDNIYIYQICKSYMCTQDPIFQVLMSYLPSIIPLFHLWR